MIKAMWSTMDKSDRQMFMQIIAGTVATVAVWWFFSGRKKYSTKGMN